MLSSNERITPRQFQILFVLEAFGTGFVVMPRLAAGYSGQDGWLLVLLLAVPGLFFAGLIAGVAKGFGREPFALYTRKLLSAPLAAVVCLMLWAKILFCAGLELRLFGEIINSLLLERTPVLAVYITLLVVAGYAAYKGIETRARLAEILIVVIGVPMIILGIVALTNSMDFTNLMPALVTPPEDLLTGVMRLGFIFTGLEFIWLAMPYITRQDKSQKAVVSAMAFTIVLMAVITACTLAKFGLYNTRILQWPVLILADMITIPGSLIARQQALVLSFWMLSVFAFAAASLFYSAVLGRDQVGRGSHLGWVTASGIIVCVVAMVPFSTDQIYQLLDQIFWTFGLGFWVGLPVILYVMRKIRGKKIWPAAAVFLLLFTGCWDAVEIENRAFAVAFGIDVDVDDNENDNENKNKAQFNFTITAAQQDDEPDASPGGGQYSKEEGDEEGEGEEDEDDEDNEDKEDKKDKEDKDKGNSTRGKTLVEAIHNVDARSSRKMFLGQAKTVVFGSKLLENRELFIEALHVIENKPEIDRTITTLVTRSNVPEILKDHPPSESKPGYYVVNFYKLAPKSGGRSFHKNFKSMMGELRSTGNTLLPLIQKGQKDGDIRIEGALAIKDFQLAGELDGIELRGILWSVDKACEGAVLTIQDDSNTSMTVNRHRTSMHFSEGASDNLRCIIEVRVKGEILHFREQNLIEQNLIKQNLIEQNFIEQNLIEQNFIKQNLIEQNQRAFEEIIAREIGQTEKKLKEELELDGFNFRSALRRQNYSLYQKYADNWQETFMDMEIQTLVRCDI